ncbi:MAG TPA: tetratricopeptide repeat protein [Flavobacteriales bacterium]|nr:tetratricopeptide repeat protein [Flavobacteriales bacterium]
MELKKIIVATCVAGAAFTTSAQTPLENAAKLTDNERFEDAAKALRSIIAAEPTNGDAWFLLGENYYANEQLDSADAAYKRGEQVNPLMPLNAIGTGKVLQARGMSAEAKAIFDRVIAQAIDKKNKMTKPMQANVYREVAEGLTYGTVKDPVTALDCIEKAIVLNPNDAELYIVKGDALFEQNPRDATAPMSNYKKAGEIKAASAKPIARKAYMYYRAKNWDAAIGEYDNAVTMDPAFAPAYRGRAEAYYFKRDFAKATADYDKYLELNKGNTSARVRYAQFLFLVGKYSESLALINELQGQGVQSNTLLRLKGYDMVELKDAGAMSAMDAYFAAQPADQVLSSDLQYYGKAISLMGNDSLAGEKLLQAARMKGADAELFMEAGSHFQKAKLFAKAVEAYRGKVMSAKVAVNDWYYLGGAAQKAKMYTTADSAWTEYIAKQPNIYQGYLGRARANAGMDVGNATWQAQPFFEDVVRKMKPEEITKSPTDAEEAYFYLAVHYYSLKELGASKCWLEKAKALNTGSKNTETINKMLADEKVKSAPSAGCELQ